MRPGAQAARPGRSPTCAQAEVLGDRRGRIVETHRTIGRGADELAHQRIVAAAQGLGRALRGDAAIGDEDDVIGDREGLVDIVRDDDAGHAERVVELADQPRGHAHRDRIKAGEGLVIHDQLRIERDRARQRDAPAHAAGDLAGHQVACAAQAHRVELHQHEVADHWLGQVGVLAQGKGDVVEHRQVGEQRTELEQHAHAPTHRHQAAAVERADVGAVEAHLAGRGLDLAADQAQHRGLAAPGGAHQRDDRTARDHEIDIAQDDAIAIAAGHPAQLDQRRGRGHGRSGGCRQGGQRRKRQKRFTPEGDVPMIGESSDASLKNGRRPASSGRP